MVQFLEYLAREVNSLKDILCYLCPETIDHIFQIACHLGQCDSLLIEIFVEPVLKVLHTPFQLQEFVFESHRYTDGHTFL